MKKLFFGLLLVYIITFNIYAEPMDDVNWTPTAFGTTAPLAAGYYIDRYTDTALFVTSSSISLVNYPTLTVIWTASTAPFHINCVNTVIPAHWAMVSMPDGSEVNTYYPAQTLHYFEFTTTPNSTIHTHFKNADSRGIGLRFTPVTRDGRQWIDVHWDRLLLDPLGMGYFTQFYKSYVRQ